MKKALAILCGMALLCSFAACSGKEGKSDETGLLSMYESAGVSDPVSEETGAAGSEPSGKEEDDMLQIKLSIGNQTFKAVLYDNETARALLEQLPMTLDMSELNGNEKYRYLETALPTNAGRPSGINAGDLMLYGNNCLVLFYESFSTSYSYTPLGRIDDPKGLADALGKGSVTVTFTRS